MKQNRYNLPKTLYKIILLAASLLAVFVYVRVQSANGYSFKGIPEAPSFSRESGVYKSSFSLELIHPAKRNIDIYYTLDGSDPDETSIKYEEPIMIGSDTAVEGRLTAFDGYGIKPYRKPEGNIRGTVVKAVAVSPVGEKSSVSTGVYLPDSWNCIDPDLAKERVTGSVIRNSINPDEAYAASIEDGVDIISIVVSPEDLIGYERGIMALGREYDNWVDPGDIENIRDFHVGANYNKRGLDWERNAYISVFRGGQEVCSGAYGIRIRGKSSTTGPQKGFNIYARDEYGAPLLPEVLFCDKVNRDKAALKKARSILTEGFIMDRVRYITKTPKAWRPVSLFLNGEYWGLYMIFEKLDETYFEDRFGADKGDTTLIKNDEISFGTEKDYSDYTDLCEYIASHDMSDETEYSVVEQRMDLKSFISYYAIQSYINNTDTDEDFNIVRWKSRNVNGGKWRWELYDIDASLRRPEFDNLTKERKKNNPPFTELPMLKRLLANWSFKIDFVTTYCNIANVAFNPELLLPEFDRLSNRLLSSMEMNQSRYGYTSKDDVRWNPDTDDEDYIERINEIREFWERRRDYALEYLREYFDLEDIAGISLNLAGYDGKVYVNDCYLRTDLDAYEKDSLSFADDSMEGASDKVDVFGLKYFEGIPLLISTEKEATYRIEYPDGSCEEIITDRFQLMPEDGIRVSIVE